MCVVIHLDAGRQTHLNALSSSCSLSRMDRSFRLFCRSSCSRLFILRKVVQVVRVVDCVSKMDSRGFSLF